MTSGERSGWIVLSTWYCAEKTSMASSLNCQNMMEEDGELPEGNMGRGGWMSGCNSKS
jgi:hypothetical protein